MRGRIPNTEVAMTSAAEATTPGAIRSLIPARIDRLPWSPFHTRMVIALGVAWILDGLEITVAGAVVALLTKQEALGISSTQAGLIATVYLAGEVVGALFFGSLSDKLGRKKLFIITLAVYLIGSGLTALTLSNGIGWLLFLYLTRFIAGMGIGGEYAAINSAIDELIPARFRGRVDIMVNGTYWAGAIIGTIGTYIFLNQLSPNIGWRVAFLVGPNLGRGRRVPGRPGPGLGDHPAPPEPAGEPPGAGHARPRRRGREDHRLHRARGGRERQAARPGARRQGGRDQARREHRLLRARP